MTLGERIASMRGFRRYTQEQLGALVGVTKQPVGGHVSNVMWLVEGATVMLRVPLAA